MPQCPSLDRAVSVFLDAMRQQGLEDRIQLVVCGEMGRTPKINEWGGRDYWPKLTLPSCGRQSDHAPVTHPQLATMVLQTLVDPDRLRLFRMTRRI